MIHFFDPENKFWAFIAKLADVFMLSLLWVITSIPLFTIGAATAALYEYTLHQVNDTESTVWHGYFTAFRAHFKKATLLWLLQAAVMAFLGTDLWFAWRYFETVGGGAVAVGLLAVIGCVLILAVTSMLFAYPILSIFDFPLKKVLSNSFIMAVGNLPSTITILVIFALAGVAIYNLSGLFFYWFALAVFFSSYFVANVFRKYTGEQAEAEALRAERKRKKKQTT
jgi:uncharacterized membrane protein YesL